MFKTVDKVIKNFTKTISDLESIAKHQDAQATYHFQAGEEAATEAKRAEAIKAKLESLFAE